MHDRKIGGIVLIAAGIGIILNKLGYLTNINLFGLLATVYLVYTILKSLYWKRIYGVLIPISLIIVINAEYLGIVSFNPWILVIAAVLISTGLSMIFRPKGKSWCMGGYYKDMESVIEEEEGYIFLRNSFSETIEYLKSNDLGKVRLESNFGSMKIYFDSVTLKNNEVDVILDVNFSGVELYVPKDWEIKNRVSATFGGVKESGRELEDKTNTLNLLGNVDFSGVEIHYI